MPGFGNLVQKAFYLGVGVASYAGEKAGTTLTDLRGQAQKIADEMVERGELTTEDARRLVDEMMQRAQQQVKPDRASASTREPRQIEILDDETVTETEVQQVDDLRHEVQKLQDELQQLRRNKSE